MIKGGLGGGKTISGLKFETRSDLRSAFTNFPDYTSDDGELFYKGKVVARLYKKFDFYKKFLKSNNISHEEIISKRLLPDESIFIIANKTLFIIEMKFQEVSGSVDEKLQTCDFKSKQYRKLMAPLNIEVEYIYILNDWFKKPEYKDTLDYVISVGCQYYFHYLPLQKLGLPVPKSNN